MGADPLAPMGGGTATPVSPMLYYSDADYAGKAISMTIMFDAVQNLTGATLNRDIGCLYHCILIGLGPDGKPDSTTMKFVAGDGATPVTQADLNGKGLFTYADLQKYQVTAGF